MEEQFGFGIIGSGVISEYHAQAIKAQPDAKIDTVVHKDIEVEDKITSWAVSDSKEILAKETITEVKGKAGTAASSATEFPVEGHIIQVKNLIAAVRIGEEVYIDEIL